MVKAAIGIHEIRGPHPENEIWPILVGRSAHSGELMKLGIHVSQATVAKYMSGTGSHLHKRADLSEEPYAGLGSLPISLWCNDHVPVFCSFCDSSHDRRRPIHFAVDRESTAEWRPGQLLEAFPLGQRAALPAADRDGIYWRESPRSDGVAGLREVLTAPNHLAESLRRAVEWIDSPRVLGPRHPLLLKPVCIVS